MEADNNNNNNNNTTTRQKLKHYKAEGTETLSKYNTEEQLCPPLRHTDGSVQELGSGVLTAALLPPPYIHEKVQPTTQYGCMPTEILT